MAKPKISAAQKEKFYKTVPKIDYERVINDVSAIVKSASELTPFEADFLKELARSAQQFREELRLSKKQTTMLAILWAKYALPSLIDAKTKPETTVTATTT